MKTSKADVYRLALDLTIDIHKLILDYELYDEGRRIREASLCIKFSLLKAYEDAVQDDEYYHLLTDALAASFDIKDDLEEFIEIDYIPDSQVVHTLLKRYKELCKKVYLLRDAVPCPACDSV